MLITSNICMVVAGIATTSLQAVGMGLNEHIKNVHLVHVIYLFSILCPFVHFSISEDGDIDVVL
jgi:hypothetical protein